MTKVGQKYKCNICDQEVIITNAGGGDIVCCNVKMSLIGEGFESK